MKLTIVPSTAPTDGDAVYNALRLAREMIGRGHDVTIFVMNDCVDCVREDFAFGDVRELLDELIAHGIHFGICTTCVTRCGMSKADIRTDVTLQTMSDLADLIESSDKVLTF